MGSQAFMDPCSPLALTPEGSLNSVSTGALALSPSPLPARLPVLDQSAEQDRVRYMPSHLLEDSACLGFFWILLVLVPYEFYLPGLLMHSSLAL